MPASSSLNPVPGWLQNPCGRLVAKSTGTKATHGKFSNVWPRQDPPKINGDLQDVARGVHEGFDELLDLTAVDEGLGRVSALFAESQDSLVRSPAGSALCQRRTA